jgi:anti-anti-sigma factor
MMLSSKVDQIAEKQVVITVTGSMTAGTQLKVLDAQIQNLVTNGARAIVFDLTDVDFIDSAGLGLLMLARSLLERENAALRLCGVQARVRALLRMTRTDSLLQVDEDREGSLRAISEG